MTFIEERWEWAGRKHLTSFDAVSHGVLLDGPKEVGDLALQMGHSWWDAGGVAVCFLVLWIPEIFFPYQVRESWGGGKLSRNVE